MAKYLYINEYIVNHLEYIFCKDKINLWVNGEVILKFVRVCSTMLFGMEVVGGGGSNEEERALG